jgi:hypothetical protein
LIDRVECGLCGRGRHQRSEALGLNLALKDSQ